MLAPVAYLVRRRAACSVSLMAEAIVKEQSVVEFKIDKHRRIRPPRRMRAKDGSTRKCDAAIAGKAIEAKEPGTFKPGGGAGHVWYAIVRG